MKYQKGKQSEYQKEFEKKAKEAGYKYIVVNSFDMFREVITDYFS